MNVTSGQVFNVEVKGFKFSRSVEDPNSIDVTAYKKPNSVRFRLPAGGTDMAEFIAAYQLIASQDLGTRTER